MITELLTLHPERVPDDPRAMRWIIPPDLLTPGRVSGAPGKLGEWLVDGTIRAIMAERAALWIWLDQADWRARGPAIRQALVAGLGVPEAWTVAAADAEIVDLVAHDVIDHSLSSYIASHHGFISVVRSDACQVEVNLEGACADCPASGMTVNERIQTAINDRLARPITVLVHGDCPEPGRRVWLPFLRR